MITLRPGAERGHFQHGWLDSRHSFSFADYHDPKHMGFRALRVINEDRIQPGQGFAAHSHRDMEIVTYVLEGALEHKDSLGTSSVMRYGDVQRMSAGSGITHSEYNHSTTEPVHLLQIWVLPDKNGIAPGYEQRSFSIEDKRGGLCLIAAGGGRGNAVAVQQDIDVYAGILAAHERVTHALTRRHAWLQVARGAVDVQGTRLIAGDGAAVSDETVLEIAGVAEESEVLLFDLA
ncbi:MAG: pirin family protein [Gammaproteobacteria bacterium]|nr:pirin family protein [Gammaproteobacteria bacterium]